VAAAVVTVVREVAVIVVVGDEAVAEEIWTYPTALLTVAVVATEVTGVEVTSAVATVAEAEVTSEVTTGVVMEVTGVEVEVEVEVISVVVDEVALVAVLARQSSSELL